MRLKLKNDQPLQNFAINFNLRRYIEDSVVPVSQRKATSSEFKGVCWDKGVGGGSWKAVYKKKFLGHHATEEAAAQAGA